LPSFSAVIKFSVGSSAAAAAGTATLAAAAGDGSSSSSSSRNLTVGRLTMLRLEPTLQTVGPGLASRERGPAQYTYVEALVV